MSRWYANRQQRQRARLLAAFAFAAAFVGVAQGEVGGQANPVATLPAPSHSSSATLESPPPLLMYDVRRALEQMERQV